MSTSFRNVASLHDLSYFGGRAAGVKQRLHTMVLLMGVLERSEAISVDIMAIAPGMGDSVRVECYFGEERAAKDFSRSIAKGSIGEQYKCSKEMSERLVESIGELTWLVVVFL